MKPKQVGNAAGGGGFPQGEMRYPKQLIDADTDYVVIDFHEYNPPFSARGFADTGGSANPYAGYNKSVTDLGKKLGGTIILYMPEDVSVQYGGQWDSMNFSNIARGAMGAVGKGFDGQTGEALKGLVDTATNSIKNATTKGTLVAKALSEALQATNFGNVSVNDIYAGVTGQILNPNTEVLYKGPKMRGFSLNFKLVPENTGEAKTIQEIIRAFKYAMLPKFDTAGTDKIASFVKVPAIADVTFMKGGVPHPYVTQFKPSAIIDLDISYTPDGAWSTYRDGSPVATTLKVTFQELKMVYSDEIAQGY